VFMKWNCVWKSIRSTWGLTHQSLPRFEISTVPPIPLLTFYIKERCGGVLHVVQPPVLVFEDDAVIGVLPSPLTQTMVPTPTMSFHPPSEVLAISQLTKSTRCWMVVAEAEWRTEVGVAMDAFIIRVCRDTDDEPMLYFRKSARGALRQYRIASEKRIREIQN